VVATTDRTLAQREHDLNTKILSGEALEAFEEHYADEVTMMEGNEDSWTGKATNRAREEEFFAKITELRALELHDVAVGDGVTMSRWHYDFTHEEFGDQRFDQVAVRHWKDGQIVREQFFKA
jgi:hypothetical protein